MMSDYTYPVIDLWKTGQTIRRLIKERKLTVEQVRDRIELESVQAMYKWFRGECCPKIDNLLALSRLLNVSIDSMIVSRDEKLEER